MSMETMKMTTEKRNTRTAATLVKMLAHSSQCHGASKNIMRRLQKFFFFRSRQTFQNTSKFLKYKFNLLCGIYNAEEHQIKNKHATHNIKKRSASHFAEPPQVGAKVRASGVKKNILKHTMQRA